MEGDPGNPVAKLKRHRNAQDMDEREYVGQLTSLHIG